MEIEHALEDQHKIGFIRNTTESIGRLGFNTCNYERFAMRDKYIAEILEKRKILASLTQYEIPEIEARLEKYKDDSDYEKVKNSKKPIKKEKTKEINEHQHMIIELKTLNQAKLLMTIEEYVQGLYKSDVNVLEQLTHFDPFDKLLNLFISYLSANHSATPLGIMNEDEIKAMTSTNNKEKLFIFTKEHYA